MHLSSSGRSPRVILIFRGELLERVETVDNFGDFMSFGLGVRFYRGGGGVCEVMDGIAEFDGIMESWFSCIETKTIRYGLKRD